MQTELNLLERLKIVDFLIPMEGNIVTLRMVRSLIDRIGPSPADLIECEVVKRDDGKVQWNEKGQIGKPFEFEPAELELIKGELNKLNNQNRLNHDLISLFEKFCTP